MRKPINEYCRQEALGWHKMPVTFAAPVGEEEYTCVFARNDGIQFCATVKECPKVIHVTLAPVKSLRLEMDMNELVKYVQDEAAEVLETFFGTRVFLKAPDDKRYPNAKHYFHMLEVYE